MVNTFRFNLSEEVICSIRLFVDQHFDKDSKDFKEIWNIWYSNHNKILKDDQNRLLLLGYNGDYQTKVYVASRYYFKNKAINEKNKYLENKNNRSEKRTYIMLSLEFMHLIQIHINTFINDYNKSPAEGFNNFIKIYNNQIEIEIRNILENNINLSGEILLNKIKKSYKNSYYQYIKVN